VGDVPSLRENEGVCRASNASTAVAAPGHVDGQWIVQPQPLHGHHCLQVVNVMLEVRMEANDQHLAVFASTAANNIVRVLFYVAAALRLPRMGATVLSLLAWVGAAANVLVMVAVFPVLVSQVTLEDKKPQ